MAEVINYRPEDDAFFRWAISLRELPGRLLDQIQGRVTQPRASFGMDNFTLLEQQDYQELAFGLAGQFWKADYGQAPLSDAEAFLAFCEPASARLLLSFRAQKLDNSHTRLTTETRIFCQDPQAKRKFTPYWYLIRPVSGLIRQRMLRTISQRARAG